MNARRRPLGPNVDQLVGPQGGRYPDGNPLQIRAGESVILLDSATHLDPTAADLLLLSHFHEDHVVGAGRRTGPVVVHEKDAGPVRDWEAFVDEMGFARGAWEAEMRDAFDWAPIPGVSTYTDDEVFDLGGGVTATVIPMPGHTAGHCGFLIEPDGVLFLADVDLSAFGPLYSDRSASLGDMRRTVEICAQVEARCYATFHHKGPFSDRAEYRDALAKYASMMDVREARVVELLGAGRSRADEMVGEGVLYRPGPRPLFADHMEREVCVKHLEDLVSRGLAVDEGGDFRLA